MNYYKKIFLGLLFVIVIIFSSCGVSNTNKSSVNSFSIEPGETKYFVTFNIAQSHFTLDLSQHLKDKMNDIDIEVMVDKDYYDAFEIGDTVTDDFRWGSFITNGSFGNWDVTIKNKREIVGEKIGG